VVRKYVQSSELFVHSGDEIQAREILIQTGLIEGSYLKENIPD
jgi:hypothetical protein